MDGLKRERAARAARITEYEQNQERLRERYKPIIPIAVIMPNMGIQILIPIPSI